MACYCAGLAAILCSYAVGNAFRYSSSSFFCRLERLGAERGRRGSERRFTTGRVIPSDGSNRMAAAALCARGWSERGTGTGRGPH